jgi:branched-chain amino acid transport system permease protein
VAYLVNVATLVCLFAVLGISLNWLLGYGGMFSVAHGAFLGIGAYAAAIGETRLGLPPILAGLLAIAVTAVAGTLLGYTAIRVSGEFLIIASFGVQEVASSVYTNANDLTGGSSGIVVPSPVSMFGLPPNAAALVLTGVVAILAFVVSHWLANSRRHRVIGLCVRALHEDEIALAGCGRNVHLLKLTIHAGSFALVGLMGAIYAHMLQFVAPDDFSLDTSVLVLTVVAIGGAGHSLGPLVGAVVAIGLPELLTFTPLPSDQAVPVQRLIYGGLLVFFMLFRRNGLLNPDYRPSPVPRDTTTGTPEGAATVASNRVEVREA